MRGVETIDELHALSTKYSIPWIDLMFIAVNANGARSTIKHPRVRMQLRPEGQREAWQIILPVGNPASPFELTDEGLYLNGYRVAELVNFENDDVVLSYLRAGGVSVTLNTYSRSTCIGCLFCPNIIEEAADETVTGIDELGRVLRWICAENDWSDLSSVETITVCSGCFKEARVAVQHMSELREASRQQGFSGRLHLLSSVVRERKHLEELAAEAGPFHLTLTLECFTRRSLLLKDSKASLSLDRACEILYDCQQIGILGDFTYVAGIDPLEISVRGIQSMVPHVGTFPRIQVYQAHNDYMKQARSQDAGSIEFYIQLRRRIEGSFYTRGLSPLSWENYRPLWYSRFVDEPVRGPRV